LLIGLMVIAGAAVGLLLVGLVSWPLMAATISTEGEDWSLAFSRAYSYVYQVPWHYLFYNLVALLYGAVVVFFVVFLGSLMVYVGKWGMSLGTVQSRDPAALFVYAPTSFQWRELLLQGAITEDGKQVVEQGQINDKAYEQFVSQNQKNAWIGWNIGSYLVAFW